MGRKENLRQRFCKRWKLWKRNKGQWRKQEQQTGWRYLDSRACVGIYRPAKIGKWSSKYWKENEDWCSRKPSGHYKISPNLLTPKGPCNALWSWKQFSCDFHYHNHCCGVKPACLKKGHLFQLPVRKHTGFPKALFLQKTMHFGVNLQVWSHPQLSLPSLQIPVHPIGTRRQQGLPDQGKN